MTWLQVTAVAVLVLTWPVAQFGVMIATILLPGMAGDRIRARRHRAATREDHHDT